ncbi:hypothetical protein Q4Q39_17440 [Flavivirga amylovorans]|uniref:Uncharacterized protein n=1 Tax=Flavivirga amylovorans TaxID=870486 RepID=A0ABT8X5D0_9FLAO|nr:hypothetical protein [Flavivirga amylovorans]MDO5989191.1 hypothetical protein [Flavivirga amylovorans]
MEIEDIENKISLKRKQLAIEKESYKRSEIQKELKRLNLKKEIEFIKNRIASLG